MIRRKNGMSREKFLRMIQHRGYEPSKQYIPEDSDSSIWKKINSNIILEVRRMTYVRVILFDDGQLGYIESLPFNKNSSIY